MSTVQKDMINSVIIPLKGDDVPSLTSFPTYESDPNGEEPNATARPWADHNRSETGPPGQENHGNRADPSHNDVNSQMAYDQVKVELHLAALKGDWKMAKSIFDIDLSNITMPIGPGGRTALHIAVAAKHISFVENLVQLCSPSDLAAKDIKGYNALIFAAISGVVRIAKVMVDKNSNLPNLHDPCTPTPAEAAVAYKRKDMAYFLFSVTNFEALDTKHQIKLLLYTISSEYYDIALKILKKKPELATKRDTNGHTALHALARKPTAIGSSSELSFWKRYINSHFDRIYNKALMEASAHQIVERVWNFAVKKLTKDDLCQLIRFPSNLLLDAAEVGNAEFLIILLGSYPDCLWVNDENKNTIFHIAVKNRQESVFNLIYETGGLKDVFANFFDFEKRFNMLHLVGLLASPVHLNRVSGAALQMQRELLWFKEVEKIVEFNLHDMRCNLIPELSKTQITKYPVDNLTPRELFTKQHEELRKLGEDWMKNTANSCMLVATLIATVVFAAAFTVPGGNDDKEGIPKFLQNQAFTVFVISDAAALVLSTTSILTFLSILTSRYAEEDFLESLPSKLLFGLVTLFVSIACMVVAFSATFVIAYEKTKVKIPLAIAVLAIFPIGCFGVFHSRLVVDILQSTYWSKFSFKRHKKRLF